MLTAAKGIWELLGHADNLQPRLLFYFSDETPKLIVFVYAFMKKSKRDYKQAIELAQKRRALIERGERPINVIGISKSTVVH